MATPKANPGPVRVAGSRKTGAEAYWQLMYLGLMFFDPVLRRVSALEWAVTLGGIVVFLPLYFQACRVAGRRRLLWIAAIVALGLVVAPFNFGAFGYHIYAAALLAHSFRPRVAIQGVIGLLALIAAESWLLSLPKVFWIFSAVFVVIVGVGQIFYGEMNRKNAKLRRTQEEVERLATVAERERIARDLHDLLGHTLSLVTLKAELAARLVDREPQAAGREMREVEEISRKALSEVRKAVTGYRKADLATARVQAEMALDSAGVHLEWRGRIPDLDPEPEHVLALALREGVTNVVRHARALTCRIAVLSEKDRVVLEIADDGRGGGAAGAGLAGMRERVQALGGTVERHTDGGTRLRVTLPVPGLEPPAPEEPAEEPAAARGTSAVRTTEPATEPAG